MRGWQRPRRPGRRPVDGFAGGLRSVGANNDVLGTSGLLVRRPVRFACEILGSASRYPLSGLSGNVRPTGARIRLNPMTGRSV